MFKKLFKSDILFSGYYGHLNTGDDAFVEVASWGAAKYWSRSNNVFLGRKSRLPKVSSTIRGYPFEIPKTYSIQAKLLLSSTHCLVSAGGSTLHKTMQANDVKQLAVAKKLKGSNIKVGGIGVSIGPFKTARDEREVFNYLKYIDFLAVRDTTSFEIVKDLNLPYQPVSAFDLAALLPDIYGVKKNEQKNFKKKVLGVSVCNYESIVNPAEIKKENYRNSKVVELLKFIEMEGNVHFKFFVINGHSSVGDLKLTRRTIKEVSPASYELLAYNRQPRIVWDEISSCDFIISTRLHAAIFACFSNTPFLLNEYHRKCSDFLDNVAYDISLRAGDAHFESKEKARDIIDIMNGDKTYNAPMRADEMKGLARLNFTDVGV